jgi:hypothetical protein
MRNLKKNLRKSAAWLPGVLGLAITAWPGGSAGAQQPAKDSTKPAAAAPSAAGGAAPTTQLAAALGLTVYPSKEQSAEQQATDEQACYTWAKEQTGIDPAAVKTNPDSAAKEGQAKANEATSGAAVGGAARGAAGGAVVGAIAGDAGTGAAIGAVAGAAGGRRARKSAEKQGAQQAQAADASQANQKIETFKKAMSACLDGRGYSVK